MINSRTVGLLRLLTGFESAVFETKTFQVVYLNFVVKKTIPIYGRL